MGSKVLLTTENGGPIWSMVGILERLRYASPFALRCLMLRRLRFAVGKEVYMDIVRIAFHPENPEILKILIQTISPMPFAKPLRFGKRNDRGN